MGIKPVTAGMLKRMWRFAHEADGDWLTRRDACCDIGHGSLLFSFYDHATGENVTSDSFAKVHRFWTGKAFKDDDETPVVTASMIASVLALDLQGTVSVMIFPFSFGKDPIIPRYQAIVLQPTHSLIKTEDFQEFLRALTDYKESMAAQVVA
jgi:hypothetical protein